MKVGKSEKLSYLYLIGAVAIAAVIIIIAAIGISLALFQFTGIGATEATIQNFNNAQWENVVFTEYHPVYNDQGSWDGYYLSSDGRRFYTNSKLAYQNYNLELFNEYSVYTYKIELSGFPDNAWGIKAVAGTELHPTSEVTPS